MEPIFKNHVKIVVPYKATKLFKRGHTCYVMVNKQWYSITPTLQKGDSKLKKKIAKLQAQLKQLKALKKEG